MKKIITTLAIYGSLAVLAAPAFTQVQTPSPKPAPAPAQGACSDEAKGVWYADFTKFRTTEPTKAYDAAQKYLAACPTEEGQIPTYLKKWVAAYEKEARKLKFQPLLYNDKKYQEALALGKEMLSEDAENLRLLIDLGYGSYLAAVTLKNETFNADALTYARKAIQLIDSGKVPESWAPFKGKEDTLAYLYNVVGRLSLKDNPSAALSSLIKEAQFETELKKDPWTYHFIAAAYEAGPYAKLSADYKTRFEGKDETPESKLALENVNQVIDRMVDAYARAVALAGNDPKHAAPKKEWMDGLSTWYKYRHNASDTGLTEMIASVLSKPLPPEPTPLTSLPAGTPTTTTTPASGSPSSTTGAMTPAASKVASGTTTVAPTVTPKTTTATGTPVSSTTKPATTDAKPKPKSPKHHRRH